MQIVHEMSLQRLLVPERREVLSKKKKTSSPVATAEFSKFAGILNTALKQQHLLTHRGFGFWERVHLLLRH